MLHTASGPVHLISAYAPTLTSSDELKYDKLDSLFNKIPPKEQVIILGDLNARVGADNEAWSGCLGKHGGKINQNGRLF